MPLAGNTHLVVALAVRIMDAPHQFWAGTGHRLADFKVLRNGIAIGDCLSGCGGGHIGALEFGKHCAGGHTID